MAVGFISWPNFQNICHICQEHKILKFVHKFTAEINLCFWKTPQTFVGDSHFKSRLIINYKYLKKIWHLINCLICTYFIFNYITSTYNISYGTPKIFVKITMFVLKIIVIHYKTFSMIHFKFLKLCRHLIWKILLSKYSDFKFRNLKCLFIIIWSGLTLKLYFFLLKKYNNTLNIYNNINQS